MDPRAKTLLLAGAAVFALLPPVLESAVVHVSVLTVVCLVALGPRDLMRTLRVLAPLLFFVIALTPLFHTQGAPLIAFRGNTVLTERGLWETIRLLCRLVAVVLAFHLYVRCTEMEEVVTAARWFGLPRAACLVLGVVFRLVPGIAQVYRGIVDAHSLRRSPHRAGRRGVGAAIRRTVPVLTAVLVHAVKGIPVLAMALESRGVGRHNPRSSYRSLPGLGRMLCGLAAGLAVLGLPQVLILALWRLRV